MTSKLERPEGVSFEIPVARYGVQLLLSLTAGIQTALRPPTASVRERPLQGGGWSVFADGSDSDLDQAYRCAQHALACALWLAPADMNPEDFALDLERIAVEINRIPARLQSWA